MADLKTSILVNRQVPEFVREENPKFIAFLEAYYEFLENQQNDQKNDLITKSKDLRYLSDVDYSLEQFESGFYGTFLSLLPQGINLDKATLIKNILPIYLSKGSEKSFQLLFKLLFGDDVRVNYPKNQILMASSGQWEQNNILRVSTKISTQYTSDGTTKDFKLAQQALSTDISVYVNGALTTSGFVVLKEYKKIVFDDAPSEGSDIVINYSIFDYQTLSNRKITGKKSNATALVEKVVQKQLTENPYLEVYINEKTLNGDFTNGESIITDIIVDSVLVNVSLTLISDISKITVINGGASYNVGDPVIVRGNADRQATAIVDKVASGLIEDVIVVKGGAGFQVSDAVEAVGFSNTFFDATIQTVNTLGVDSANSIIVNSDTIEAYANVPLNASDYGFPTGGTENVNSVVSSTLSNITLNNLGEITTVWVNSSLLRNDQPQSYLFNALSPAINSSNTNNIVRLQSLGIIGRIDINNGGTNYVANDALVFNYTTETYGRGAVGKVKTVDANGTITSIEITDGGLNHSILNFPTITVTSSLGTNANLTVNCIMGDGETIEGSIGKYLAGQVLSVKLIDSGTGYLNVPAIDLSRYGNGGATANADIQNSYLKMPGKWNGETGLLSTENIKIEGREYFVNYSYVLSSKIEFNRYKDIFKQFIHPAGTINYGEYVSLSVVEGIADASIVQDAIIKTISGTANINSSVYVTGTNTYFLLNQTDNLLDVGTELYINNEKRTVDAVISNTSFTVSTPFTTTANGQDIIIVT